VFLVDCPQMVMVAGAMMESTVELPTGTVTASA
jgi:hypothetical protein